MPRGQDPKSRANLTKLTTEEARKRGQNGGIASGKARAKKKLLRECLDELMAKTYTDVNGHEMSGAEVMATRAMQAAMQGDWKAWELVRDTNGQKPVEKVQVQEINAEVQSEIDKLFE